MILFSLTQVPFMMKHMHDGDAAQPSEPSEPPAAGPGGG
jgi:intracellular septation protein